jgi:hypothetical protein
VSVKTRRDRGAVSAIAAVLFGSGLVLGLGALVLDVGVIYAERGQLQNGADAAALKVGQVCARTPADCNDLEDVAVGYAGSNANDGAAAVAVCGTAPALPGCAEPEEGAAVLCVGDRPTTGNYAEVLTTTELPGGSTLLPPVFAQSVLDGYRGTTVGACARVAWGAPSRTRGLAMTVDHCAWEPVTALPSTSMAIPLGDGTDPAACGFRWLTDRGDDCRATMSVGNAYPTTSAARPEGCLGALTALRDGEEAAAVPILDQDGNVRGFTAFVVSGWQLSDSVQPGPGPACTTTNCVQGHFVRAVVSGGGAIGGPDLGARTIALTG